LNFKPISLQTKTPKRGLFLALVTVLLLAFAGYAAYFAYDNLYRHPSRWANFRDYNANPQKYSQYILRPSMQCTGAPFAFPTTGVIFGLWDQAYRPGHRHQGIDIFPGGELGVTGVYAAYPGYLSRLPDWISTVIIRIPEDPLEPNRQIWVYYTHMADQEGNSFISEAFPPATSEVFVPAGTFLGYVGNYSGDPDSPTGLHLHVSVVKDEGGTFLNEINIRNTYDPSPYFNLPVNYHENPNEFPICEDGFAAQDWALNAVDEWDR
jgi:murein DD-endopeptidase MepM/ murein hydrolase activator NlpD